MTKHNHKIISVCNNGKELLIGNGVPADKIVVVFNGIVPYEKVDKNLDYRKEFGIDKFVISETITKTLPQKEKLVTKNGNEVNIDFNVDIPDETGLSAFSFSPPNNHNSLVFLDKVLHLLCFQFLLNT